MIDIGGVGPEAELARTGVERTKIGVGTACANRQNLTAIIQRTDGADVHGTDQPLTDKRRAGRFVDHHFADDFGRILIELDPAIVVRRRLLTSVQQGLREIGAEAADRDDVGTAVEALRRNTRQTRNRFADRGIGQFADVFRRHRFHHLVRGLFLGDGGFQRSAEAADHDLRRIGDLFLDRLVILGLHRRGLLLRKGGCGQEKSTGQRSRADAANEMGVKARVETGHGHQISPPGYIRRLLPVFLDQDLRRAFAIECLMSRSSG